MPMPYSAGRNAYRGAFTYSSTSDYNDLFAVNPLRRSFCIVASCWALLLVPAYLLEGELRSLILIGAGWLAATGIIMCTPILIWCLVEEIVKVIRRRITPPIDVLTLSPRAARDPPCHQHLEIPALARPRLPRQRNAVTAGHRPRKPGCRGGFH